MRIPSTTDWQRSAGVILMALATTLAGCAEAKDDFVVVGVRFANTAAASRATTVSLVVYEMDDGEVSPCPELLAGAPGEPIGLRTEMTSSRDVGSTNQRPISVVFAGSVTSGTKVIYADASDSNGAIFVHGCTLAVPDEGTPIDVELK